MSAAGEFEGSDRMIAEFVRDAAAVGAVLGYFASSWFGWALDGPPRAWRGWLIAGAVMSVLVAVASSLVVWQHWSDGTVFDAATSQQFGIVVGVEVTLCGLGAWLLSRTGRSELVSGWIALIVGLHFFVLAPLLSLPLLHIVAAAMTIAALAAVPVARRTSITVSTVSGTASGAILLTAAAFSLITAAV